MSSVCRSVRGVWHEVVHELVQREVAGVAEVVGEVGDGPADVAAGVLHQAVGVEGEECLRGQGQRGGRVGGGPEADTERGAGADVDGVGAAVGVAQQRWRVPGAGEGDLVTGEVEVGVEAGDEAAGVQVGEVAVGAGEASRPAAAAFT
jgi:hypothetical protein